MTKNFKELYWCYVSRTLFAINCLEVGQHTEKKDFLFPRIGHQQQIEEEIEDGRMNPTLFRSNWTKITKAVNMRERAVNWPPNRQLQNGCPFCWGVKLRFSLHAEAYGVDSCNMMNQPTAWNSNGIAAQEYRLPSIDLKLAGIQRMRISL